jgi:antirestriction protein
VLSIYVADLAAYNSGKLHGDWLDLEDFVDADDVQEAIDRILAESPVPDAEEFAIHDYESTGFDVSVGQLGEYVSIKKLMELEKALAAADEPNAFAAFLDHHGGDVDFAIEHFQDAYRGHYKDVEDFAHEWLMDVDEAYKAAFENPSGWTPKIDTVAFECDFNVIEYVHGVYVFDHV